MSGTDGFLVICGVCLFSLVALFVGHWLQNKD